MDSSLSDVGSGSDGAVDLRVTSRDDVTSGRPLDLTLSVLTEAEEKSSSRCDASTPPDTPTSPAAAAAASASAFKKTMLKRYSTRHGSSHVFCLSRAPSPRHPAASTVVERVGLTGNMRLTLVAH